MDTPHSRCHGERPKTSRGAGPAGNSSSGLLLPLALGLGQCTGCDRLRLRRRLRIAQECRSLLCNFRARNPGAARFSHSLFLLSLPLHGLSLSTSSGFPSIQCASPAGIDRLTKPVAPYRQGCCRGSNNPNPECTQSISVWGLRLLTLRTLSTTRRPFATQVR